MATKLEEAMQFILEQSEGRMEQALAFYQRSPDGQFDDIAEAAIRVALEVRRKHAEEKANARVD